MNNTLRNTQTINAPLEGQTSGLFAALRPYAIPIFLFLLGVLLYADATNAKLFYSWDDNRYIEENTHIKAINAENIQFILFKPYFAAHLPVTLLTYMVEYALWGMRPGGYHITNILLNACNGVLVFYFIKRLQGSRTVALITAVLFLVHPVQVESVAWVAERKSVLSLFFFLLAWLAHMRSTKQKATAWALPLAYIFFFLSVFAKPTAVGAVILFAAYDYFWTRFSIPTILVRAAPYAIIGIIGSVLILTAHKDGGGIKTHLGENIVQNTELAAWVHWDYAASIVAPFDLNNMYVYTVQQIKDSDIRMIFGFALFIGTALFAWRQPLGKPFSLFAVLWIVVMLLPVANIVPIAIQRADRYLYYPSIVIFMLFGIGFKMLWERYTQINQHYLLAGILGGIIAIGAVLTVQRVNVWENEGNLWEDHLKDYPTTETGLLNAGVYYFRERNFLIAKRYFTDLLRYFPFHFKGNRFMAIMLYSEQDYVNAIPYIERAIQIEPVRNDLGDELGVSYFQTGLANFDEGRYQTALDYYQKSVPLLTDKFVVYNNIGFTYFNLGRYEDAIDAYQTALNLNSQYVKAANNMGAAALVLQNFELARDSYQRVADLNGQLEPLGMSNFCLALTELNEQKDRAIALCQQALSAESSNGLFTTRLAYAYLKFGQPADALPIAQQAVQLGPNSSLAYRVLGDVEVALGNSANAQAAYTKAIELDPANQEARDGLAALGSQ